MDRKYYLINCTEFPENIKVNDEINLKNVEGINAAYFKGNFVGSFSEHVTQTDCKVLLIGKNVNRNMKLLVEAAA